MAEEQKRIHCSLCTPETDLAIPLMWSSTYALEWFYSSHVAAHAAEVIDGLTDLLRAASLCRKCRGQLLLKKPEHRPCFDVDCCCICSRVTTTTQERSARADG